MTAQEQTIARWPSTTNRWLALTIIFLSFLPFTINWFLIIGLFPGIAEEFHLGGVQLAGLASAFFIGYGVAHIPAGILVERTSLKFAILFGILLEGAGGLISAWAPDYSILFAARVLCGVGGATYFGAAVALTTAWFREHEIATANSVVAGAAFAIGAAIGLYGWSELGQHIDWRDAAALGVITSAVAFLLMAFVYPMPPNANSADHVKSKYGVASLRRVFGNARLWGFSVAFFAGYGCYFTAVAVFPGYATKALHLTQTQADVVSAVLLLSGAVGPFFGSWIVDRGKGLLAVFLVSCLLEALAFAAIPHVGFVGALVVAFVIGAFLMLAFVIWLSVPGIMHHALRVEDLATAIGLLLTVGAIAGVVMPWVYSTLAAHMSPALAWYVFAAATFIGSLFAFFNRELRDYS